jgi:hypothetical protein
MRNEGESEGEDKKQTWLNPLWRYVIKLDGGRWGGTRKFMFKLH